MTRQTPPPGPTPWTPATGPLLLAAALLASVLGWWWLDEDPPAPLPDSVTLSRDADAASLAPAMPAPPAAAGSTPAGNAARPAAAGPTIVRHRETDGSPSGDTTADLSDYVNPGEAPSMAEVIQRLHQAGVHTGLGAFQPPGTKPTLIGVAVPEDYPLPPGYVRHYQTTDDGQRLEAILMYHPDHPPPEAGQRSLERAADRVVPPELAPSGLAPRLITLPARRATP